MLLGLLFHCLPFRTVKCRICYFLKKWTFTIGQWCYSLHVSSTEMSFQRPPDVNKSEFQVINDLMCITLPAFSWPFTVTSCIMTVFFTDGWNIGNRRPVGFTYFINHVFWSWLTWLWKEFWIVMCYGDYFPTVHKSRYTLPPWMTILTQMSFSENLQIGSPRLKECRSEEQVTTDNGQVCQACGAMHVGYLNL